MGEREREGRERDTYISRVSDVNSPFVAGTAPQNMRLHTNSIIIITQLLSYTEPLTYRPFLSNVVSCF